MNSISDYIQAQTALVQQDIIWGYVKMGIVSACVLAFLLFSIAGLIWTIWEHKK